MIGSSFVSITNISPISDCVRFNCIYKINKSFKCECEIAENYANSFLIELLLPPGFHLPMDYGLLCASIGAGSTSRGTGPPLAVAGRLHFQQPIPLPKLGQQAWTSALALGNLVHLEIGVSVLNFTSKRWTDLVEHVVNGRVGHLRVSPVVRMGGHKFAHPSGQRCTLATGPQLDELQILQDQGPGANVKWGIAGGVKPTEAEGNEAGEAAAIA
jgi:hypothetical protein